MGQPVYGQQNTRPLNGQNTPMMTNIDQQRPDQTGKDDIMNYQKIVNNL
jgi:hypothetical protein